MSWITGSSTGYLDLLDKLAKMAVANGVTAASINAGGTGYTVGDVLIVSGGTSHSAAKLRVTTIGGGGAITGIVVQEGGAYTVNPTNPVSVTGGTGTTATFNLTLASNGWTQMRRSQQAASATVGAGGSGGTNGTQTVTLSSVGAVGVTTQAQFSVTVAGGAITAVLGVVTPGLYEEVPANPVAVIGAGLTGATLNVTWANPTTQEQHLILRGTGGGSDTIYVGIRTFNAANGIDTAFNWAMHGFTAFNSGLTFQNQAGISPGYALTTTEGGAFVPLHNNGGTFPLDFWFSITPNRIIGYVKIRNGTITHYASFHVGFINRFGSPSEWPYPLVIAGSTSLFNALFNSTNAGHVTGLCEVIGRTGTPGPMWYRRSDSTWVDIRNSRINDSGGTTRTTEPDRVVFPVGNPSETILGSGDDVIAGLGGFTFDDLAPTAGVPGTEALRLHPTPNTGGAQRRLYPATIILSVGTEVDIFGELDGIYWVSASDITTPLTSEDLVTIGTTRYRVFKSGNRALDYTYQAVKEQ